jgi:two-component system nitrate/nitrite response regulator NarL
MPNLLTPREWSVLECVAKDGASNKAIARALNISDATVKVHLKAVLRRLNVSNRTMAAIWFHRNVANVIRYDI